MGIHMVIVSNIRKVNVGGGLHSGGRNDCHHSL
uniref:Uncharacterized protein n=1 Tax=viral metagenome TaxID=1070528 RepID=A0A6C0E6F1_9ZZZZ